MGTTGCKALAFSTEGRIISSAYQEYDTQRPEPGWGQLDSVDVWKKIKSVISQVASQCKDDPIKALAVSSLGEAVVPVAEDREILGPSILNYDTRGREYLDSLGEKLEDQYLFGINGNVLGNDYTLTKLLWIKEQMPELYNRTYKFLHWGAFVAFMLGSDPVVDYSLANRSLLFDINKTTWSEEVIDLVGLDQAKLPETAPAGKIVGTVSDSIAAELGLPKNVSIVTGAHDDCSAALGCGVIDEGRAMYSLGTFISVLVVYNERKDPKLMIERGLNTEHHAKSDKYVSFLFNQGGVLFKWFRDTFATKEASLAQAAGRDIYSDLFSEIPDGPSKVMVLPHFTSTGPPEYISESSGVMVGLTLETSRGDILKGILEGATFYLKECVDSLSEIGTEIKSYCAVGGGSKSDTWVQITADIMGRPFIRPKITEAGSLGAAILAGTAKGIYSSIEEGVKVCVKMEKTFEPNSEKTRLYNSWFEKYKGLWPLMSEYLKRLQ